MAPKGKRLTEEQIERYHRDGFVHPIEAFVAEEARRYRRSHGGVRSGPGQRSQPVCVA